MSNNYDLDVITYTKLITAFFKARKVADALELLFDEMLSRGLRKIIRYSWSTINVCSLLSHKWWVPS